MSVSDASVLGGAGIVTILLIAIGAIVGLFFYFLPFIIALLRGHPQKVAIFFLNFFLGWSFLGWVISLVWSFINHKK